MSSTILFPQHSGVLRSMVTIIIDPTTDVFVVSSLITFMLQVESLMMEEEDMVMITR